jgi:hypothetical protein
VLPLLQWKGIITYPECVTVALSKQRAMFMRHVTLLSVPCPAVRYFSTLSLERKDFRKEILMYIKCVFDILYNFFVKHHILGRTERGITPLLINQQ